MSKEDKKAILIGVGIGIGIGVVAVATAPAWLPAAKAHALQTAVESTKYLLASSVVSAV